MMLASRSLLVALIVVALVCATSAFRDSVAAEAAPRSSGAKQQGLVSPQASPTTHELEALELAIRDLSETYGQKYAHAAEYLARLKRLRQRLTSGRDMAAALAEFVELRREALLANPLLDGGRLLVVKRKPKSMADLRKKYGSNPRLYFSSSPGRELGMPSNHECNSSLERDEYDNEIAILSPISPDGKLTTLYRPKDGGYVGEVDLHWDADRLLFTKSDCENWKVWEMRLDGSGLRQVTHAPADVDCFDPCYLPSGKIIFGSTGCYQSVPCWHGLKRVTNLCAMDADGSNMRQLCFDQDHDLHPCVLPNGQIVYSRWDYTGIIHVFLRELMVMNPDGTGQRAVYGSNSWYPNSLYFSRPLPGSADKLISLLSGYHGPHRMGQLVVIDLKRGWYEAEGLVQRISGRGEPIRPIVRDNLVEADWPKFLHPYPLSDKYFLVACWKEPKAAWSIYLADVFDNLVPVREEPGCALLEPILVRKQPKPPVIPDRTDPGSKEAVVYLHDIHSGLGLAGVPRGAVKSLRVLSYDFAYPGIGGPDMIGFGGPWEVMRILGTVPLQDDGSAMFRVPAQRPIAVQALDAEGKAVQLMRSWFTAQPGEVLSCVGCHDRPADTSPPIPATAARQTPRTIDPWHGPPRGFDFTREVQPVLDVHCTSCHDGSRAQPDLRRAELVGNYEGRRISDLGVTRLYPEILARTQGKIKFSPAYDALIDYIRRVGLEDDASLLTPGEYHADTSPLVQLLRKGHYGVHLDQEAWDRLVTWIDLNAPCHGTWSDVYPIPDNGGRRRLELRRLFGTPAEDLEMVPELPGYHAETTTTQLAAGEQAIVAFRSAKDEREQRNLRGAKGDNAADGRADKIVDLGDGVTLRLVQIPAGEFLMGQSDGQPDERPPSRVAIRQPFWMSVFEVTNEQYRRFDRSHNSGYYTRRHARQDDQGLTLDDPQQPVVRVSWAEAMDFCRWLSNRSGLEFSLPTEAQWEYACRAGTASPLSYGQPGDDFSSWANVADLSFTEGAEKDGRQVTGGVEHMVLEGAGLADRRFRDGAIVTAPVGSYRPNTWGLYDMHGNAAEWTLTSYKAYPYAEDDGRNAPGREGRKVVRGGSFFDNPSRCSSAFRLEYPAWQRVFNVGFRVVCEAEDKAAAAQ